MTMLKKIKHVNVTKTHTHTDRKSCNTLTGKEQKLRKLVNFITGLGSHCCWKGLKWCLMLFRTIIAFSFRCISTNT